jgi:hypothetical protein
VPAVDFLPVRTDDIAGWTDDELWAAAFLAEVMLADDDYRRERNEDPENSMYRPVLEHFRRRLVERRLDAMCAEMSRRSPAPA